jgi:hypothetical protein
MKGKSPGPFNSGNRRFHPGEAHPNPLLDAPFGLRLAIHQQGCRASFSYATAVVAELQAEPMATRDQGLVGADAVFVSISVR